MRDTMQALDRAGGLGPGTLNDNLNSSAQPVNRQQRRAMEREIVKAGRELSRIEDPFLRDLGFEPDATEVADLIGNCLMAGIVTDPDRESLRRVAAALGVTGEHPALAYAVLVRALRSGPAAGRALDVIASMFGTDAVIELRAVLPRGGAHSYCGRIGHEREGMLAFIRSHLGTANLYLGINPRKAELAGTETAGNANHVQSRRHVVLDLDLKDAPASDPDWTRTLGALRAHDSALVVDTGNGLHVWFNVQPVEAEELAASVSPLAGAMAAIGSDNMADSPRIIRLPWTINVPTKQKRERGARLALASVQAGQNPAAFRHGHEDLARRIEAVARALNLPGKGASKGGSTTGSRAGMPAEHMRSPNGRLLRTALSLLPNNDRLDRQYQSNVAHAVRGASMGADFEADARGWFLDWSAKYPGADPDHDARLWDGVRDPHTGFGDLLAMLRDASPAGYEQIRAMLGPIRLAAARAAFAGQGIDPVQAHLLDPAAGSTAGGGTAGVSPAATPIASRKGEPPHTLALRLLTAAGAEIYRDTTGRVWIKLAGRNYDLGSRDGLLAVCGWLSATGVDLTGTARSNFKEAAEARAMIRPPREVHFRQADGSDRAKPAAFINLMDGSGTGVHVDGTGWRVGLISTLPVEMADRSKAMPLPDPMRANDGVAFLDRWGRHVPLALIQNATDPRDLGVQHRAIWICFLLSQFYRPGTVPHLLFAGHQGSGKTTTARRATGLTDPDSADVLASLPADETAIYAIASQQTNLVIDNVSSIRSSHSDVFCALASGTAYQKRQLYTDGERAVFRAKTSVMLTSIRDELIQREDLMDRTLVLSLPRLDRRKRKSEGEMNDAWERDLPFLFADLLDLLAAALARLPNVQAASSAGLLPHPPRFADAALLAEAAFQSLGWKPGLCLDALNATRQSASADQLENNPVAFRVRELVRQGRGAWSGSPAALLDAIRFIDGPEWHRRGPTVSSFTHALSRAEEPMRQAWGLDVRRSRDKSGGRLISLHGPAHHA